MRASLELSTNIRRVGDMFVAECSEMGLKETGKTEEEARYRLMLKAEKILLNSMVESSMLT
jgi:hypothetical protein